ncbi:protein PLANT CADMIUM RESISTANCE 2-like [Gigantopelta aegis]|uniref:protein PLANT CADMIUM RESISTANCE 2-like n=1 Tax=Gigantopelta aegis TaxID=1735272 RepID=UPI001B88A527|nr:protein PLANT CADMIUM RESISTANCE 2-like [Gigantopelta aegis]
MSSDWQHGICGCFDNLGICIIAYVVPCYTAGKNAEAVGNSCCLCGLAFFIPIVNICAAVSTRGKLREQKGIDGSCLSDFLTILFCPLCAMVQEAQETQGMGANYMVRE